MGIFDFFRAKDEQSKQTAPPKKSRKLEAAASNRFTGDWNSILQTPNAFIKYDLKTIRARSRDSVRNNEYAKRALEMYKINVVGERGIQLQNQSKNRNGRIDRPASQAIEQAWKDWSRAHHCDISRRYNLRDIQRMIVASLFTDGEAFIRKYKGALASESYRFALQIIDPALIDPTYSRDVPSGNSISGGIEYDRLGRPVAYHIMNQKGTDNVYTYNGQTYLRVPADEMLHIFIADHPDQNRGLPIQTAGLLSLHYIHEYRKTALIAARAGASAMIFVTSPESNEALSPDALYDEEDEEGPVTLSFDPLTFQQLPEGTDIKTYDSNYPTGEFGPFVKTHLQAYASSVGVSYALLTGDLEGVNFSSLKNANAQEREHFKGLQQFLVDHFLDPIYADWLKQQLIHQTITIGGVALNAMAYDKYLMAKWVGTRWQPLDELKSASANRIRLEDGTITISDILAADGLEFDDVIEQRKMELEALAEAGLVVTKTQIIEVPTNGTEQ